MNKIEEEITKFLGCKPNPKDKVLAVAAVELTKFKSQLGKHKTTLDKVQQENKLVCRVTESTKQV